VGDITSPDSQETSQEPQTYTKEHVDKLLEKVRSDSLAEFGRVRKAAEDAIKKATESSHTRITQLLKEQEERELELSKGNPDAMTVIKERNTRRQRESELTRAQEELNEARAKIQEFSTKDAETVRERVTRETAERLKVDPVRLAKLAKFTDGSASAIEELAGELPKLTPARNNLRPDSNETAGGTPQSVTQIQQDYIKGKINTVQYGEKMKALGRQP
jgi:hypothetical protein